MESNSRARAKRTWELAGSQHGVVTRQQLLALGFSPGLIAHRISRGRLHPVERGVYAVGWPRLDRRRRWAAAVLAAARVSGDPRLALAPYWKCAALLSHSSAAALWQIGGERPGQIEVTVRLNRTVRRPGLRVRRRPFLSPTQILIHDDIPVTSPVQTLIDMASELDPIGAERAVNEADKRDLIDPESLRIALDGHPGEPGVQRLRKLLDRLTFRLSDSDLEIYFRPIAARANLPIPLSKQRVNGFEVDFFWPDLGLVVETDGLRYHRTPSAQARDAARDRAHVIAGMAPLRFTHYEIRYEPQKVQTALVAAAKMLRNRIPL